MFVTRNGVFLEKEFLKSEKSGQKVYLEEVQDEHMAQDSTSDANFAEQVEAPVTREESPQPQRSERPRCATDRMNLLLTAERNILLMENDEPRNYAEAMMDPDSESWKSAMRSEIDSM